MKRSVSSLILALTLGAALAAQSGASGRALVRESDLREWLTYLASDRLGGRATFSEGLALASSYIAERLREFGVKPGGDDGSYLQAVPVLGIKTANRSTLTVEVGGRSKTFAHGQGVRFPANVGGKRRVAIETVHFVGYGLSVPSEKIDDYAGRSVAGAAVVWLGAEGPAGLDPRAHRRPLAGRNRYATETLRAAAALGPEIPRPAGQGPQAGGQPPRGPAADPDVDFTTVQRLDHPVPPAVTVSDEVFEFLFQSAPASYADLKARAEKREPLAPFTIDAKLTFSIDADYTVTRTQYTHNVVGIVEGSDPALRNTYVAVGAHHDHVGYATGGIVDGRRQNAPGRVKDGSLDDRVWNGADDDGSGTATTMAVAKAFAQGPRPRRSVVFVWHAGEERGLWGSRYFVDFAPVPPDGLVAQLNLDMVGRNRDDKASEANTVYIIGSDRISTELHNLNEDANNALAAPLALDYEMNDPADPEQLYTRSDHYSYAARGIPVVFYTTGLHPDYHTNDDEVEKINFEKMTRIGQLVYETAWRAANLDHAPVRDNRGPRAGKGTHGKLTHP
jgi:hypothetical protein